MSQKGIIIRRDGKSIRCPLCYKWFERKLDVLRVPMVMLLECNFCKIKIAENDPFVGRWEEVLQRIDPADHPRCPRPGCETLMRYFATSTGAMVAKCPKEKCGAMMTATEPDREQPEPGVKLLDREGNEVTGIDRPVATPEDTGLLQ